MDMALFVLAIMIEHSAGVAGKPFTGMLNILLPAIYFAVMNYRYGGTLGQLITGVRVAVPNTLAPGGRLLARAFIKSLCLFPPMMIVYGLVAIWRKDGRSLADFVAGSVVVRADTLQPPTASLTERIVATCLIIVTPWMVLLGFLLYLTHEYIFK